MAGFCYSAEMAEIEKHGFVLTPGRYVGAAEEDDDGEPFEHKMKRLVAELQKKTADSGKLDKTIASNLDNLGFGFSDNV